MGGEKKSVDLSDLNNPLLPAAAGNPRFPESFPLALAVPSP
jgi:hypothetical protein